MKLRAVKKIPFEFVLEALDRLQPRTNAMFGCTAIYIGQLMVLILRDKETEKRDNGVWLATSIEHHESLRKDFPSMRSIEMFQMQKASAWQNLASESESFEADALKACELILKKDPRIGKIPKEKKRKKLKS